MARTPQLSNQLQIDQATLSPVGTPGKARTDGKAGGQLVTLTNTGTGTTTRFRLLDVPLGDTTAVTSLAATGSPKIWTFTPTASVYGSYRIELTEDLGLSTEYTEIRIFGIRTPTAGLLLPALGERGDPSASLVNAGSAQIANAENNADDFPTTSLNTRRYAAWIRAFQELILKVEAGGGISPGSLAGAGLVVNGSALDVNPDGATLEVVADVLRVKAGGIANGDQANMAADTIKSNLTGTPGPPADNGLATLAGAGISVVNHQLVTAPANGSGYLDRKLFANAASAAVGTTVCGVVVQACPATFALADLLAIPGNKIEITTWGSGGAGGQGTFTLSSAELMSGSTGGGGGCRNSRTFSRQELIDLLTLGAASLTCPLGGAQKTGTTTAPGGAGASNNGSRASFGTLVAAGGGGGGYTGGSSPCGGGGGGALDNGPAGDATNTTVGGGSHTAGIIGWDKVGAGGNPGSATSRFASGGGGAAGAGAVSGNVTGQMGADSEQGGCGGGGGGAAGASGSGGGNGGAGGRCHAGNGSFRGSGPSGGAKGNPPSAGTDGLPMATWTVSGDGGGGGGGTTTGSVHGGNGGAGGFPGGGGGGGGDGSGANGTAWGGLGGAGGDGAIGITFYP